MMNGNGLLVLLAIVSLPAMVASPLIAERYVLRPVFLAARQPTPRTNYRVSDIACLVLNMSLAATLVKLARFELVNDRHRLAVTAVAGLFTLCTWWLGVRSLSRARIPDTLRRCVYLSVAVPLTYAGVAVVLPATVLLTLAILRRPEVSGTIGSLFVTIVTYLFLVVGLFLSRHIAHWVTSATSPRESASNQE